MAGDGVFFPFLSSIVFTDIQQKSQVLYHKLGQFFPGGGDIRYLIIAIGEKEGEETSTPNSIRLCTK